MFFDVLEIFCLTLHSEKIELIYVNLEQKKEKQWAKKMLFRELYYLLSVQYSKRIRIKTVCVIAITTHEV